MVTVIFVVFQKKSEVICGIQADPASINFKYGIWNLCVMICVCGILIKITYLLIWMGESVDTSSRITVFTAIAKNSGFCDFRTFMIS